MELSIALKIPIIVVAQSNREGANKENDEAPDLENIRDSDGISHNASIVIAAKQKGPGIELVIRKNRNGLNNKKLLYLWDIDKGTFQYMASADDSRDNSTQIQQIKEEFQDGNEVF